MIIFVINFLNFWLACLPSMKFDFPNKLRAICPIKHIIAKFYANYVWVTNRLSCTAFQILELKIFHSNELHFKSETLKVSKSNFSSYFPFWKLMDLKIHQTHSLPSNQYTKKNIQFHKKMHPSISFLNNENTISSFEIEKSIKTFFVWYANLLTLKRDKRKIHPNVPRTGGVFLPCYKKIWKNSFNILLFSHTNYKWELILRKCETTEFFCLLHGKIYRKFFFMYSSFYLLTSQKMSCGMIYGTFINILWFMIFKKTPLLLII